MNSTRRAAIATAVAATILWLPGCDDDDTSPVSPSTTGGWASAPMTVSTSSEPLSVAIEWAVVTQASVVAGHNQQSYRFEAHTNGGVAPYTFRWSFRDGTPVVEGNPVSHKFYSPGTYDVVVAARDAAGAVARSDAAGPLEIEITASPFSLSCYASPTEGERPLEVQVRAEPEGNVGPIAWHWDFGDGSDASKRIVSHVYGEQTLSPGRTWFTATATATDGMGRSVQCSQVITVTTPAPPPSPPRCVRSLRTGCVDGGRETFVIGSDGCRDDSATAALPNVPLPGRARVRLVNRSGQTQIVTWSTAGGGAGVRALATRHALIGNMVCPPTGSRQDGPFTMSW